MKRIARYTIELVKESSSCYECDNYLKSPDAAATLFEEVFQLSKACEEKMVMACLDAKCKVIGTFCISSGSLTSSVVHPREVFKRAMLVNAHGIILAHNHPSSGDCNPSTEDIQITCRLKEAGKFLGIEIMDHIIIGNNNFSFKQDGYL